MSHYRAVGNVTLKKQIIVFYAQNIGFTVLHWILGIPGNYFTASPAFIWYKSAT